MPSKFPGAPEKTAAGMPPPGPVNGPSMDCAWA